MAGLLENKTAVNSALVEDEPPIDEWNQQPEQPRDLGTLYQDPKFEQELINPRKAMWLGMMGDMGSYLMSGGTRPFGSTGMNMYMQAHRYNSKVNALHKPRYMQVGNEVIRLDNQTGEVTPVYSSPRVQKPVSWVTKEMDDGSMAQFHPHTGEKRVVSEAPPVVPTAAPDTSFADANTLRDDYRQEASKPMAVLESFQRAARLSEPYTGQLDGVSDEQHATDLAAADMGMVYSLMKAYDPGSTVMEGERATVSNASGVPARVRNWWNGMLGGESLTDEQRRSFASAIKRLSSSAEERLTSLQESYAERAGRHGINPADVFTPYSAQQSEAFESWLNPGGVPPQPQQNQLLQEGGVQLGEGYDADTVIDLDLRDGF